MRKPEILDDLESALDEAGTHLERLTERIEEIDDEGKTDSTTIEEMKFYANELDTLTGRIIESINELEENEGGNSIYKNDKGLVL